MIALGNSYCASIMGLLPQRQELSSASSTTYRPGWAPVSLQQHLDQVFLRAGESREHREESLGWLRTLSGIQGLEGGCLLEQCFAPGLL
jgi:hypothetical protein